jgi:hypothetical protein
MRYCDVHVERQCNPYNPDPLRQESGHHSGAEPQASSIHPNREASIPYPQLDLSRLHYTPHTHTTSLTMSSIIGRAAFRASRPLRASGINAGAENAASAASREADKNALKQGARKDPELYVRRQYLLRLPRHLERCCE